jgi:type I restriction enzyme S subunit
MTGMLTPYPAMKDSGVPWLGQVPEHWEARKLRNLLEPTTTRNRPDLPLLSVVREKGVIQRDTTSKDENHNFIPDDLSNYKVVRSGQLAMNKMKAWQGSYGVSPHDGIVSPAYFVFDLSGVGGAFFHSAIRSRTYVPFFAQASDGVRIGQWDLSQARMKGIPFFVPPLPEQSAIVRFLDHADRRIRRYIRAKQKLIKLLEEQKQAIIHRAVTRGLDPNVRFKSSGVEWLGDVPEQWEVKTIKRLARPGTKTFTDGDWIELPYITDHGIRLIQTGNVGRGEYREKGFRYISDKTFTDLKCTEVRPGDILICRLDGPVGRACLTPDLGCKAITSVDNTIVKVRLEVDPRYVVYFLSSSLWLDWVQSMCRAGGGFRYRVSRSRLGDLRVSVPPLIEQREIADHLDKSLLSSGQVSDRARAAIALLREYRSRLIADVVTGKLDVRDAAARLPDETGEPGPLDEVQVLAEDSEDGDGTDLDAAPEEAEA